jgi:hypothetical protein
MYKRSIFILSTLAIIFLTSVSTLSQTYGEIFTKDEANKRFGPVLNSVSLQTSSFQGMLNQTNKYIMLKIKDGNAIILDSNRKAIYPIGKSVNSADVFSVYSASVMNELLKLSTSENIFIEQRNSVLTVSNGAYTLEMAVWCPPICPDDDD